MERLVKCLINLYIMKERTIPIMIECIHDKTTNDAYINLAITKIKACKKAYDKAQELEDNLFTFLQDFICDDLDNIAVDADNADNLKEAIACYLLYGEWDVNSIKANLYEVIPKSE